MPCPNPPVQPLGRICVAIPFTDNIETNQAILAAITWVQNTIHPNEEYVSNIIEITELLKHCDTKASPVKMIRWQLLLHDSTKSGDWTQNIPLTCHLLIMSPMRHLPYCTICKSQQALQPPEPEFTLWPADQLCPSNCIPKVSNVQGLKLTEWEQEYHKFCTAFTSELSCCVLAQQEELKDHLP